MRMKKNRKTMSKRSKTLPAWADIILIPLLNLTMALGVSALIIYLVGESPVEALEIMLNGAFGSSEGIGYTLYYATNFIFTGLAVAIAFHAMLFNIGGEGQAYIGGLGVAVVLLAFDSYLPFWLLFPIAIIAAMFFGAAWAAIPAYLQAYRGSHIVITTIMFNFIAASLMVYLLVNVFIQPGSMTPESRVFLENAWMPSMQEMFAAVGIDISESPLNLSFIIALVASLLIWIYIWHTRWGYEMRSVGFSEKAASYAGINTKKIIMITMLISGGLAGLAGINEIMGVQHKLMLNFVAGYGFTGIAVALMGRNHPVGIIMASILFGALFQGGAELSFDMPTISKEIVFVIQGLIILFSGALAYMCKPWIEKLFSIFDKDRKTEVQ